MLTKDENWIILFILLIILAICLSVDTVIQKSALQNGNVADIIWENLDLFNSYKTISKLYNDIDTVLFVNFDGDTMNVLIFYHIGKWEGAPPDSTILTGIL